MYFFVACIIKIKNIFFLGGGGGYLNFFGGITHLEWGGKITHSNCFLFIKA